MNKPNGGPAFPSANELSLVMKNAVSLLLAGASAGAIIALPAIAIIGVSDLYLAKVAIFSAICALASMANRQ